MADQNFGKGGIGYQLKLVKAIIEDKRFGSEIISHIEAKYFDNMALKYIITVIKEMYEKFNDISYYDRIEEKILLDHNNSDDAKVLIDTLKNVKEVEQVDPWVQKTALNFCRQENFKKELKKVQAIIDNADFEDYEKIEDIVIKALQVGISDVDTMSVDFNIEDTITNNSRNPITTGIVGFDNLLNGGLGRGEVGVILAPTGVGKTTILTKFANAAYQDGNNVLHIFFEDNENQIKRKHYTIFSGITPKDQPLYKDLVIEKVRSHTETLPNRLEIKKLPSGTLTVTNLKNKIRKLIAKGFKPDLLVIDYIDCLIPDNSMDGEEWKGEGAIMRMLDAMANEFDLAIWVGTQGNRESISAEVVQGGHVGGSMKKIQIAHVVISIAKTLEQKENKLATITFIKSRLGDDGIIFKDCKFDNEKLEIDTETQNTLLGFREQQEQEIAARRRNAYFRINPEQ